MKPLPLIGALLLSTAPVQASKTFDEISRPCGTSDAVMEACLGTGFYLSAISGYSLLCDLRDAGQITPKVFAEREKTSREIPKKEYQKVMWNEGVKSVLEDYPNCPIKPLP